MYFLDAVRAKNILWIKVIDYICGETYKLQDYGIHRQNIGILAIVP